MARRGGDAWRWGLKHIGGRPTIGVIESPKGVAVKASPESAVPFGFGTREPTEWHGNPS